MKHLRWIKFESCLQAEHDPALGEGPQSLRFQENNQQSKILLHNSDLEMHFMIVSFIFLFLMNPLKLEYLF